MAQKSAKIELTESELTAVMRGCLARAGESDAMDSAYSSLVIDTERREAYHLCEWCGHREAPPWSPPPDWIGFSSGENACPLCMGWKPRAAAKCQGDVCDLNPNGAMPLRY